MRREGPFKDIFRTSITFYNYIAWTPPHSLKNQVASRASPFGEEPESPKLQVELQDEDEEWRSEAGGTVPATRTRCGNVRHLPKDLTVFHGSGVYIYIHITFSMR